MKKYITLSIILFGGIISGAIGSLFLTKFLQKIGEYSFSISDPLIYLGGLIGAFIGCIHFFVNHYFKKKLMPIIKSLVSTNIVILYPIAIILFFIGLFFGLYFLGENKFYAWLFLVISCSLFIYLGYCISSSSRVYKIIGGVYGGILGCIFLGLVYLLRINFSIDEGYLLLMFLILSLNGAILGAVISTSFIIYELINKDKLQYNNDLIPNKMKIASLLLVIVLLLPMILHYYWETMDLNNNKILYVNLEDNEIFNYTLLDSRKISNSTNIDLINFLEKKSNKTIDIFANLYLLSREEKWIYHFKHLLLEEAKYNKFIGLSGSVKAWQLEVMIRAYYYLLLTEKKPNLFNETERDFIINWFKKINEEVYKVSWVDYIYGFLFKKIPDGPYENQEIGSGLLSVLSEVLKEKYPKLTERNTNYLNNFGVGWRYNFRNPDDGIVYHQQYWIYNAYMMAKYGEHNYLINNNSKNSFEWILVQWPPNGMSPAYNVPNEKTPFDIMVLGGYLFDDGRYAWLAERMLYDEIKNSHRQLDFLIGLNYWDSNRTRLKPDIGSCYIKGTTGIAQNPGPLKPDKIIFREGWERDSLYALLNLRFSGWHSYKATNSFVTIMYEKPFVVEKLEVRKHLWLPKGKADHRDKKIDRTNLNGFQIEKTGLEKILYKITGFGSIWAQDPPKFTEVIKFNSTPNADYAITEITDWHGWTHKRASLLVKGKKNFLVVFDYATGDKSKKVGITWHFKGDAEISDQLITLYQNNTSLVVYYPHSDDLYKLESYKNDRMYTPAGEIHNPDLSLFMTSEQKSEVGFITLFYPNNTDNLEIINVRNNDDDLTYPKYMKIEIKNIYEEYIIEINFITNNVNINII